jgi:phosphohistidine phosphatase
MNIYLIRHGDAESISVSKADFDRKLTSKGKDSIKKAAEGWKKIISSVDVIASSPLTRSVQTAEIVASVYNFQEKIITDKRLSSGCKPEDVLEFIKSLSSDIANIAIVGHEPDLSRTLSAFVSSSGMFTEFNRGSLAKIIFNGRLRFSAGSLEFLIPQELFK